MSSNMQIRVDGPATSGEPRSLGNACVKHKIKLVLSMTKALPDQKMVRTKQKDINLTPQVKYIANQRGKTSTNEPQVQSQIYICFCKTILNCSMQDCKFQAHGLSIFWMLLRKWTIKVKKYCARINMIQARNLMEIP